MEAVIDAPLPVRQALYQLLYELSVGPYPDEHPDASELKGSGLNHHYVAWKNGVNVSYRVMQDQPVISLVGVHWRGPSGDNGDDGDGEEPDEGDFALAA